MRAWTNNELKKIIKITDNAHKNIEQVKFSKYLVQSLFIHFRSLIELGDFSNSPNYKNQLKCYSDISLHPLLNALYKNPFVKTSIDTSLKSLNKGAFQILINDLFSFEKFRELLTFIGNKYGDLALLKNEEIAKEIFVKYMWLLVNKPLNIKKSKDNIMRITFESKQAELSAITWKCETQGSIFSDTFTF